MTRGFVTIATGSAQYYKIAANLLQSYRYFAAEPLPFAIIAEEENAYTAQFDDVVLTTESTHSFLDKFLLLKLCPYDETIFIDADCLCYGDLNAYFQVFANSTDFSAIGVNVDLHAKEGAWYDVEGIGKYGELISYKSRVHAGVCFIRKSEKLAKMYADCMELCENFDSLYFHTCPRSVDECVFGVAMPMNGMRCEREIPTMLAAWPCCTRVTADILRGRLSYATPWAGYTKRGILMHWGTSQTYQPLYRFNVECLAYMVAKRKGEQVPAFAGLRYHLKLRYVQLFVPWFVSYNFRRVVRKLKKICKRK